MPVPSVLTDLSVSEASNNPPDTETVTSATRPSKYLRALGSILRRPFAQGATVASLTAANLGSNTDGDYFHVSGTTGLAASNFGTVSAGIRRTIVFDGALLLTHNATSFILPGAANITTAAGDVAVFRSEGAGNWKCTSYVKASGTSVVTSQPLDATLSGLAALVIAVNEIPVGSGTDIFSKLTLDIDGTLAANSDVNLATQKAVKTYVTASVAAVPSGIGVGQTWQNVITTPGRALGTTYNNSTGKPIMVSVTVNNTTIVGAEISFAIDSVVVAKQGINAATGGDARPGITIIVPNGSSYVVTNIVNATLESWFELR